MAMIDADSGKMLEDIAAEFATLPEVSAVVLAGSRAGDLNDDRSDIDLYVYAEPEPSETWRIALARKFGNRARIGNHFWEPGDEWVSSRGGIVVDIMYRSPAWIAAQLDRVWIRHEASVGYSTCFVYNVSHSLPLHDRDGWFASLQARVRQPYPDPLRHAVVAKNHPILRGLLSSYEHQIALALERNDLVSVNHRITAVLASYFDILFAVNRQLHPGEKRLVAHALAKCPKRPPNLQTQVNELLQTIAPSARSDALGKIESLLNGLDALLMAEGLIAR